jgi:hypothetical protein
LLADYGMNVNHNLVNSIMAEHGLYGLPRPGRRKPNLMRADTPVDLFKRRFSATMPNELWCTDITENTPAPRIPAFVATPTRGGGDSWPEVQQGTD